MTATAPPITTSPETLTLEQFEAAYADAEERWELAEGVPVMVPFEALPNNLAASGLTILLHPLVGDEYHLATQVGLHLPAPDGARPTIRVPDFAVLARGVGPRRRADVSGVALVAEVVSDSSVTTDLVVKRREYAAAGIPAYLVVDVRSDTPRLWLFENPGPDGYPDPVGDGTAVTLSIGEATITLTSADLDDFR